MALRRSYPQIYASDDKLLVDPRSVRVRQQDFEAAFRAITPASGRSVASSARQMREVQWSWPAWSMPRFPPGGVCNGLWEPPALWGRSMTYATLHLLNMTVIPHVAGCCRRWWRRACSRS